MGLFKFMLAILLAAAAQEAYAAAVVRPNARGKLSIVSV
jgi:hypothetical protein